MSNHISVVRNVYKPFNSYADLEMLLCKRGLAVLVIKQTINVHLITSIGGFVLSLN